jgi:hypothetical protein
MQQSTRSTLHAAIDGAAAGLMVVAAGLLMIWWFLPS